MDGQKKRTDEWLIGYGLRSVVGWLVIWLCVCDYAGVLLAMTTMTDDDGR